MYIKLRDGEDIITAGQSSLLTATFLQARRRERGARRAAAGIAIAVLLGLYECREDTDEDMLLVRMGLPGAADDLARIVYAKVKSLHLLLPSLADECPKWEWYEER